MNGNPPQQMIAWTILTTEGKEERVVALGFQPVADGSIIFGDQFGPIVAYNARVWKKITRSSIQPATQGNV